MSPTLWIMLLGYAGTTTIVLISWIRAYQKLYAKCKDLEQQNELLNKQLEYTENARIKAYNALGWI